MKLTTINSFKVGTQIKGFFLCHQKYLKITRFGDSFIDLVLKDSTGSIRGKIWSNVDYFSSKFNKGDVVAVKGDIIQFNDGYEISLKFINTASGEFYSEYGYSPDLIIGKINKSTQSLYTCIIKNIKSLSSNHRQFLLDLYEKNKSKIQTIPLEKKGYFLKGGYLLFVCNLLNTYNNFSKKYKKIDREKILICILLSHIGYIEYFDSKKIFSISKKGYLLGCKILGINILIENFPKNINENDKIFYEQCILMDEDSEDKSIKFVNYLIQLENIAG